MSEAESNSGFSCPGLFWLPGLTAMVLLHLGAAVGLLLHFLNEGASWESVGIVATVLAVFWIVFATLIRWIGSSGALNFLGLLASLAMPVGVVAGIAWLL